jgi:hypothetical protein
MVVQYDNFIPLTNRNDVLVSCAGEVERSYGLVAKQIKNLYVRLATGLLCSVCFYKNIRK